MDRNKYEDFILIKIKRDGTYIHTAHLSNQTIQKIKNYFTIRDKTIMGYDKITNCYKQLQDKLYVPRFAVFLLSKKFHNIKIINRIKCLNPLPLEYKGEPPTHIQNLIIQELKRNWLHEPEKGNSGAIINLQAGFGKTYLSMYLIDMIKGRTLIVTHNKTILKQWRDLLSAKFPNNKIATYYGEKKEYGDIVVGVINSLVMVNIKGFISPREFYNTFDLIILDECHEYCSETRSKIFSVCQAPYMIGLSATPEERNDNLSKVIKWNIGNILCASKLEGYDVKEADFKGNVIQVRYNGADCYTKPIINQKLETISVVKMIEQFTRDPARTELIANLTMEFYRKNHNIFVFADRRDYLLTINEALKKLHLDGDLLTNNEELSSIRLIGGSKESDMTDAIQHKRIILTTYAYMGTGCSIPKMDCIILATPRKTKSRQIINRIFRLGSDYSIVRQIIDIVDWKTSLKNQYYERAKYYKSQNFTIEIRNH